MRPLFLLSLCLLAAPVRAGNEALARQIKPSLVAIYPAGREGTEAGVGSGFAISPDGLIATNLHVIGEGRSLRVEFADGTTREVVAVHAWDRDRDLAVIRVAGETPANLPLGDSAAVEQGTPAVAMGNPLGFRFSMVEGMISARQQIEGRPMLQLTMPIERGNSGGPVLDKEGRVLGVVTLKSTVTTNLGFAVPVDELKALLANPHPIAMKNWLTIGALNPKLWQVPESSGSRWSQRAGAIQVRGSSPGFGGRAQCLALASPPALPYEVSVRVRLDDESGAAGLSFCSDSGDLHYGFYPSNGGLRLTRFQGPDVSAWTILQQGSSPHYQVGAYNHLRVRIEEHKITCFLNGELTFTSDDAALRTGRVGLCQFRGTAADFRDFQTGPDLATPPADPELRRAIADLSNGADPAPAQRAALAADPPAARRLAAEAAATLQKRAASLLRLAAEASESSLASQLGRFAAAEESAIPLAESALLLARLDNPDLDPAPYLAEIERMASDLQAALNPADRASPPATLAALNRYLFAENGFHGSRDDFSNKSNSYLNEVIDDREGLPITLAVLHLELGRRLGLDLAGIPLPGRFLTQLRLPDHPEVGPYIDVFDGGRLLNRAEATALAQDASGAPPSDSAWQPSSKKEILLRILNNLSSEAVAAGDTDRLLRYLAAHIALEPNAAAPRLQRFYLLTRADRRPEADADATWLLEHRPPGSDEAQLRELLQKP